MQVKKHQLELDMEQCTCLKLGKEYVKAVYFLLVFNFYAMLDWMWHKLESRLLGEILTTSDTQMTWTESARAESEEKLKILFVKVKEKREKSGLKVNFQKTKIMASSPIISWETDEQTVANFIFLGSKITTDGDCGH